MARPASKTLESADVERMVRSLVAIASRWDRYRDDLAAAGAAQRVDESFLRDLVERVGSFDDSRPLGFVPATSRGPRRVITNQYLRELALHDEIVDLVQLARRQSVSEADGERRLREQFKAHGLDLTSDLFESWQTKSGGLKKKRRGDGSLAPVKAAELLLASLGVTAPRTLVYQRSAGRYAGSELAEELRANAVPNLGYVLRCLGLDDAAITRTLAAAYWRPPTKKRRSKRSAGADEGVE